MNLHRRQCLKWGSALGVAGVWGAGALANTDAALWDPKTRSFNSLIWRERALVGFGTTLWLRAAHTHSDLLESALNDAVTAIRQVESDMSLFNPDSAVSRLNRDGVLNNPSAALLSVLSLSRYVSARSHGAFDVTVQPLWEVWSQAKNEQRLPERKLLERQLHLVNWQALEVNPHSIRLNASGMGVSLNGIAQGYAADLVRSVLQSHGVKHALIDTGETATLGHSPSNSPWRFGIENATNSKGQQPVISTDGRAVATSSDSHTAFTSDHMHHHIFNPHTGDSAPYWASVSVIAPSCVLADALTKVFFMCPPQLVQRTAKAWGVDVLMQDKRGKWLDTWSKRSA